MVFMGTSVLRGLDMGGGECLESFPQAWFYVLRNNSPPTTATSYPPVASFPPLMQPDLRSPQPFGVPIGLPFCQQDSNDANSVASYENQEPASKNEDDDEEDGWTTPMRATL
ncbi:linker for activation of T-cells family member 1 [Arvicola amphibius]|uniref:linker for activation of T-cells family member 1 n=1 Tax=Arvicola amphibius TaxID=1047088 RepID=UPI0018E2E9B2|nr:linker for activation of T-cells family member 1 [Arvicola amphibius]